MATTVGFGKLEREMLSNNLLPGDVRIAIIDFKNQVKTGMRLTPHENREQRLPEAPVGTAYYEFQVGQAHPGDPEPRGKRRLVALIDPQRQIQKMFFSDQHYTQGVWRQLQYP